MCQGNFTSPVKKENLKVFIHIFLKKITRIFNINNKSNMKHNIFRNVWK